MELGEAAPLLRSHHQAVLAAARPDGPPHVTRVAQAFDGAVARVSVTDGRVKTGILATTGRGSLHVRGDDDWHWVTLECDVALSPVATAPDDEVCDELLAVYEAVAGPHDDPAAFRRAMVDERRLVLTLTPVRVYGQL